MARPYFYPLLCSEKFLNNYFLKTIFPRLENIDIATLMLACIPLIIWSISGLVTFMVVVFGKNDEEAGIVGVKA